MVNAEQLIKLLDFNLSNKSFDNAVKLLNDDEYSKVILSHYPEVIQEVILKHLTAENYANEPKVYEACECILKLLTEKCHQEGILFEFIEIIENVKNDDIFTSILKCLQVIVLNQSEKKSRALEYCLNSIEDYVLELPLPTELLKNAEEEEEKVLENDDEIRRVLMMYMTLELFYEPVVKQIVDDKTGEPSDARQTAVGAGVVARGRKESEDILASGGREHGDDFVQASHERFPAAAVRREPLPVAIEGQTRRRSR
jgi:hypothetical protein